MHRFALAAAALLLLGATATAADLGTRPIYVKSPAEPAPTGWSGFYLGLNAGGALANGRSDFSVAGVQFAAVNNSLSGAVGGGQVGFNWQTGMTVAGLEADFQAASLKGSLTAPCAPGLCGGLTSATYSQKVPWFGTVRGRLGFASAGWLIYATGGYAYARLDTDAFASAGPASATFNQHDTRNGWTVGGGIEVMLAGHWTAKLEYLYLDLGRVTGTLAFTGLPAVIDDAHLTMSVARAGVNYKF